MSRRNISPLKVQARDTDPRQNIIRKLKEELITARGKEKQLAILQNYLLQVREKKRLLEAETIKSEQEGRIKLQMTLRTISELKKQLDLLRVELRNIGIQTREVQSEAVELNKLLNTKKIQLDKLKKDGIFMQEDKQKIITQFTRMKALEGETNHQIRKAAQAKIQYQNQNAEVNHKLIQVKTFINHMAENNHQLKQRLKTYQQKNSGISLDIDGKQGAVDNIQRELDAMTQQIKNQIENYIQLQHRNQKNIKENVHRVNLLRIQNEKSNELTIVRKKLQKAIGQCSGQLKKVKEQSRQIDSINQDFVAKNGQMKKDLVACQAHLENLIKHNAFIQENMEDILREDQAIVSIIRRKRTIVAPNHYASIRSSRAQISSPRLN